jgi:DNA-binding GntR family transcriptional regulator
VGKKEFIRNRLRDDIVRGRYEPGDPVPERVVAEELEVSRIPVREALIELERDGLVSILPRRGAYVQVFTAENMQSLYETREALEGMAARLAAQRMNPAILASLKERYERVLADFGEGDQVEITALGTEFHETVIGASRNSVIIEMSGSISDRVKVCRRLAYGEASPAWALRAAEEHFRIITAIEQHDPELAERNMREHISTWAQFLRNRIAGDSPRPNINPPDEGSWS